MSEVAFVLPFSPDFGKLITGKQTAVFKVVLISCVFLAGLQQNKVHYNLPGEECGGEGQSMAEEVPPPGS